ncbi:MAG: trypsin-like peptidase domain-containing protein [bacterium]
MRGFEKVRCVFIIFAILFAQPRHVPAQANSKKDIAALTRLSHALEELSERVNPAIVRILSTGFVVGPGVTSSVANLFRKERTSGSGVILDPEGYIVTNAHVIEDARRIQVVLEKASVNKSKRSILKGPGQIVDCLIVGVDRETDLAVLKIPKRGLPFLKLGDSDRLKQGQMVMAFGSPLGLENSVSLGVVSALARQFRPEDPMVYIQTDAPINPGNSGGPLVDINGDVVGINTFILSQSGGSEGIGFAAPSNIVRNVYEQIRKNGRVRRGLIGVNAQTITPLLASGLGLQRVWGVVLGDVYPGSPADQAGLKIGDIIFRLDDKVMENGRQFDVNLYSRSIGDSVKLEALRGSDTLNVRVAVVERPNDLNRFSDLVSPEKNLLAKLGILAMNIDRNTANFLPNLRKRSGVLVASGAANFNYSTQGNLHPGDVIHAINNKNIQDLSDLRSILKKLDVYDTIVIQIERRGQFRFITFELE